MLPARGSSPTHTELSSLPDDTLAPESNSNARPDPPPARSRQRARQRDPTNVKSRRLFPGLKGRLRGRPLRRRYPRKRPLRPEALEAPEATCKSVRAQAKIT